MASKDAYVDETLEDEHLNTLLNEDMKMRM
jgi:hypothetical protein